jgi:outer membrane murein-binding lipoprotein Lpp
MKSRRTFLRDSFIGLTATSGILVLAGCSANSILQKIDEITTDADAVVTAVSDSSKIALPIFNQIEVYLAGVQAATTKALAIDNGAAALTAAQVTQIIELYANYAVAQIPGVPLVVGAAIALVEVAINSLISLLKPATSANVVIPVTYSRFKRFQYERHNAALGSHIKTMRSNYAKKIVAAA